MTETMIVRVLELESMTWSILEATGEAPKPRGGHSVFLSKSASILKKIV